ncbi:MAG TPA: YbaB/EbfC family nucleoid-associated protein [Firmicutes bacterium]|nr:YbaB/EbfC family nucleoid-associated protein [Bacillota bacterium]
MAKGFGGMGGMNMNALMKQAQKMQKQMEEAQAALAEQVVETTSGGGAVKVTATGKKEIKEIKINPDVVDPDDVEMLEDLILSAVNEALRQVDEIANGAMSKIAGGNLGGMF